MFAGQISSWLCDMTTNTPHCGIRFRVRGHLVLPLDALEHLLRRILITTVFHKHPILFSISKTASSARTSSSSTPLFSRHPRPLLRYFLGIIVLHSSPFSCGRAVTEPQTMDRPPIEIILHVLAFLPSEDIPPAVGVLENWRTDERGDVLTARGGFPRPFHPGAEERERLGAVAARAWLETGGGATEGEMERDRWGGQMGRWRGED